MEIKSESPLNFNLTLLETAGNVSLWMAIRVSKPKAHSLQTCVARMLLYRRYNLSTHKSSTHKSADSLQILATGPKRKIIDCHDAVSTWKRINHTSIDIFHQPSAEDFSCDDGTPVPTAEQHAKKAESLRVSIPLSVSAVIVIILVWYWILKKKRRLHAAVKPLNEYRLTRLRLEGMGLVPVEEGREDGLPSYTQAREGGRMGKEEIGESNRRSMKKKCVGPVLEQ